VSIVYFSRKTLVEIMKNGLKFKALIFCLFYKKDICDVIAFSSPILALQEACFEATLK